VLDLAFKIGPFNHFKAWNYVAMRKGCTADGEESKARP